MKRLLLAMLTAVIVFGLCACGGSESPETIDMPPTASPSTAPDESDTPEPVIETSAISIGCGDSIDNENFLMTFDSMELFDEYSYSIGENVKSFVYVEDGYKLLAVKGHFENKSTGTISSDAFLNTAIINDSYTADEYDVRLIFLRNNSYEIDPYTDYDYLIYVNIPEKLAEMFESAVFTIGFKNDMSIPAITINPDGTQTTDADNLYEFTSGISSNSDTPESDVSESSQEIAVGDTITTDDYEFTLQNVEFTYELLPSDTSSVYTSYPADQGKVYIHVAAALKNLMKRDFSIDETFSVKALYSDGYKYDGFVIVDIGNRFDWVSSYSAAAPLETAKIHGLIECPLELESSNEKLVVIIKMSNDAEYQYTIRT